MAPDTLLLPMTPDSTSALDTLHLQSVAECARSGFLPRTLMQAAERYTGSMGHEGELLETTLLQDDLLIVVLLISFALVTYALVHSGKYLREQMRLFFFPLRQGGRSATSNVSALVEHRPHRPLLLVTCMVSASACMLYFDDGFYYTYTSPFQPIVYTTVLFFFWLAYVLVRRLAHSLVGSIFFSRAACRQWLVAYRMVAVAEGLAFFLLALILACAELPRDYIPWLFVGTILLAKLLLFIKAKSIFFSHWYGFLHNLLYLCTLEMAPLFISLKIVTLVAGKLMEI